MSAASDKRLIERSLKLRPSNTFNVVSDSPSYPLVNDPRSGTYTRPQDIEVLNTFQNNVLIPSNSGNLSNILNSGGAVDINIPRRSLQIADKATLRFTITNNTGAATTLVNAFQLIDYVQVSSNNGQNILSQIDGDYLYLLTSLYDSTEWAKVSRLCNTTAQWGAPVAIANGATVKYYVPLVGSLFNQAKLNIENVEGDIVFRIFLRPFSQTNAAAGTAPLLQDLSLIINQVNLDISDSMRKKSLYNNNVVQLRYLDSLPQKFSSQTLAASSQYEYQLNSLTGMISHMYIVVRPAGAVGNSLNDFKAISSFDILDSQGISIINMPQDHEFNLFHEFSEFFPGSAMTEYKNVYTYSFSNSPRDAYANGFQAGYLPFEGYERLRINTSSALVPGSYDVIVYPVTYQMLKINRGIVTTTRV